MPRRKPRPDELAAAVPQALARLRERQARAERNWQRRAREVSRYVEEHEADLIAHWAGWSCPHRCPPGACEHFTPARINYSALDFDEVARRVRVTMAEVWRLPLDVMPPAKELLAEAEAVALAEGNVRSSSPHE